MHLLPAVATERPETGLSPLGARQLINNLRVVQLGARLFRCLFAGLFNQGRLGLLLLLAAALRLVLLARARCRLGRHRLDDCGRLCLLLARRGTRARLRRLLAPASALGLLRNLIHDGCLSPARAGRLPVARARGGRVRRGQARRREQGQGENGAQHSN